MAKINLLPWRDELRQEKQKEFIYLLFSSLVLGLALSGLMYLYYDAQLADHKKSNDALRQEMQKIDQSLVSLSGMDVKRKEMEDRIKVVQSLQEGRPTVVHLFDELTLSIPNNLFLTKFERRGNSFIIEGKADNPTSVAEFSRRLDASPWYRNTFMKQFEQPNAVKQQATIQEVVQSTLPNAPSAPPPVNNEIKPPVSLVPRLEDHYGTFLVSADLEESGDQSTGMAVVAEMAMKTQELLDKGGTP